MVGGWGTNVHSTGEQLIREGVKRIKPADVINLYL